MIKVSNQIKSGLIKGQNLKARSELYVKKIGIEVYTTHKKGAFCCAKYQITEKHNLWKPRRQMDVLVYNRATRFNEHN